jgi:hypothetical protein
MAFVENRCGGAVRRLTVAAVAAALLSAGSGVPTNRAVADTYVAAGGNNATFNFPNGIHRLGLWSAVAAVAADEAGHAANARGHANLLTTTTALAARV